MIAKLYSCINAVVSDICFKNPFGESVIVYNLPYCWVLPTLRHVRDLCVFIVGL
jgi:hypothetical protein